MKISFNFNIITIIMYLIIVLSGYINYLIISIIVLTIHELGHIFTIYLSGYKIESITILPFGGIINTNINYNINSIKLFLISISGIIFQILALFLIKDTGSNTYHIFYNINVSIIILNLFPIIPLDGSKIIQSFTENYISYKKNNILLLILSIIFIIITYFYTKKIILISALCILNYKNINNLDYIYNRFLLERYLSKNRYKKDKIIQNINKIYKNRNNYILIDDKLIEESTYYKSFLYHIY